MVCEMFEWELLGTRELLLLEWTCRGWAVRVDVDVRVGAVGKQNWRMNKWTRTMNGLEQEEEEKENVVQEGFQLVQEEFQRPMLL